MYCVDFTSVEIVYHTEGTLDEKAGIHNNEVPRTCMMIWDIVSWTSASSSISRLNLGRRALAKAARSPWFGLWVTKVRVTGVQPYLPTLPHPTAPAANHSRIVKLPPKHHWRQCEVHLFEIKRHQMEPKIKARVLFAATSLTFLSDWKLILCTFVKTDTWRVIRNLLYHHISVWHFYMWSKLSFKMQLYFFRRQTVRQTDAANAFPTRGAS